VEVLARYPRVTWMKKSGHVDGESHNARVQRDKVEEMIIRGGIYELVPPCCTAVIFNLPFLFIIHVTVLLEHLIFQFFDVSSSEILVHFEDSCRMLHQHVIFYKIITFLLHYTSVHMQTTSHNKVK